MVTRRSEGELVKKRRLEEDSGRAAAVPAAVASAAVAVAAVPVAVASAADPVAAVPVAVPGGILRRRGERRRFGISPWRGWCPELVVSTGEVKKLAANEKRCDNAYQGQLAKDKACQACGKRCACDPEACEPVKSCPCGATLLFADVQLEDVPHDQRDRTFLCSSCRERLDAGHSLYLRDHEARGKAFPEHSPRR